MGDMHENDPAAVWKVVEKVGITMVITRDGDALEGRPLQAYPDEKAGLIYFMTDSQHVLDEQVLSGRGAVRDRRLCQRQCWRQEDAERLERPPQWDHGLGGFFLEPPGRRRSSGLA